LIRKNRFQGFEVSRFRGKKIKKIGVKVSSGKDFYKFRYLCPLAGYLQQLKSKKKRQAQGIGHRT